MGASFTSTKRTSSARVTSLGGTAPRPSSWAASSRCCAPGQPCSRERHGCRTAVSCSTMRDRKSTRLNSSHSQISYAVFCLKKKKKSRVHTSLAPWVRHVTRYAHRQLSPAPAERHQHHPPAPILAASVTDTHYYCCVVAVSV